MEQLKEQADAEKTRLMEHAGAVKAQLCGKLQQAEKRVHDLTSTIEQIQAELQTAKEDAVAASEDAERELMAAKSQIEMLSSALKGTEQDKEQALDAISNMYQHTDKQLKAMAGAGAAPVADAGSLSRIATLQVFV